MKPKLKKGDIRLVKKTTLAFDADLHKHLRIQAIEEDISMTALIEREMAKYLKGRKRGS